MGHYVSLVLVVADREAFFMRAGGDLVVDMTSLTRGEKVWVQRPLQPPEHENSEGLGGGRKPAAAWVLT